MFYLFRWDILLPWFKLTKAYIGIAFVISCFLFYFKNIKLSLQVNKLRLLQVYWHLIWNLPFTLLIICNQEQLWAYGTLHILCTMKKSRLWLCLLGRIKLSQKWHCQVIKRENVSSTWIWESSDSIGWLLRGDVFASI